MKSFSLKVVCLFFFLFSFLFSHSHFERDNIKSNEATIQMMVKSVRKVLDDNWFIVQTDSGFTVNYCKTCNQKYLDSVKGVEVPSVTKEYFYEMFGPDSISNFSTVSYPFGGMSDEDKKEWYGKTGVLSFNIYIEEKWEQQKVDSIQTVNDAEKKILMESYPHVYGEMRFSDYRYWVPNHKKMTRLPYNSAWYGNAIFINPSIECFLCSTLLAKEEHYYNNPENFIEDERVRALFAIAYALGIRDYNIVNSTEWMEEYYDRLRNE